MIILRNLPKAEARRIKECLTDWLWQSLHLILSLEKTAVTHILEGFTFLGYKFLAKKGNTGSQPRVKMTIPHESIRSKTLAIKTICSRHGDKEQQTIQKLNQVIGGWMNFYKFVTAPTRAFSRILSKTWYAYGSFLSRKRKTTFAKAAKKWVRRCPPSKSNPKGGQKTWMVETVVQGQKKKIFLICRATPRGKLREIAQRIYRNRCRKASWLKV